MSISVLHWCLQPGHVLQSQTQPDGEKPGPGSQQLRETRELPTPVSNQKSSLLTLFPLSRLDMATVGETLAWKVPLEYSHSHHF